jgi:hypothetical protein
MHIESIIKTSIEIIKIEGNPFRPVDATYGMIIWIKFIIYNFNQYNVINNW